MIITAVLNRSVFSYLCNLEQSSVEMNEKVVIITRYYIVATMWRVNMQVMQSLILFSFICNALQVSSFGIF